VTSVEGPALFLDGDLVDALASVEVGLDAARVSAGAEAVTGRVQIADDRIWMRVLAGIVPELGIVGYKEFHRVGQRVRYHVSIFDRDTADMIGVVDGRRITSLRTASTAALAFEHADDGRPKKLAVIGSGEEAKEGLRAVAAVSTLAEVAVFSPTPANREAFCEALGPVAGVPVYPVTSVDEALAGAQQSYVATSSAGPAFLEARQVGHLQLLAGIGSTRPNQRELIGDIFTGASQVVFDCADARHEPGDVIEAIEQFGFDPASSVLLRDWLESPYEPAGERPLVFKSIGTVEQDLALAHRLLVAAREQGLGIPAPEIGTLRIMRDPEAERTAQQES
jgi:ornithine cyclodeaminase/alanine dehydrogenase